MRAAGAGLRCNGDPLVSRFVCDGRVNCMMPGREAVDEQEQFCSSARHTETDTGNKLLSFIVIRMIRIQNFLPGRRDHASIGVIIAVRRRELGHNDAVLR